MKNQFIIAILALILALGISSSAMAQAGNAQGQPAAGRGQGRGQAQGGAPAQARPAASGPKSPWKFYPQDRAIGDGGPAPKRELTGTWAGPGSGMAVPRGDNTESPTPPVFTPLGKQLFDA